MNDATDFPTSVPEPGPELAAESERQGVPSPTPQAARRSPDGKVVAWLDVPERAERLGLEPHPEGGWYRRTWTSPAAIETERGVRPAATVILFLLAAGEFSAWHRVESDELWLWHGPAPVAIELGGSGESPSEPAVTRALLGPDDAGADPARVSQFLVPAGVWQRTLPSAGEALVSCMVSPGFSFDDFTLAE